MFDANKRNHVVFQPYSSTLPQCLAHMGVQGPGLPTADRTYLGGVPASARPLACMCHDVSSSKKIQCMDATCVHKHNLCGWDSTGKWVPLLLAIITGSTLQP
jgi:hypothetical protein